MLNRSLLLAAVVSLALAGPLQAQYSESLGDFDGPAATTDFPLPPVYIGTFTPGVGLAAATISGTYGSDIVSTSTAGFDLFLDGIMVAQCVYLDPGCWQAGAAYRPWSYTFSGAELSIFDDGLADLTVVQTSQTSIRLGSLTLEGRTVVTPEPMTAVLLAVGLLGMAFVARKREELLA